MNKPEKTLDKERSWMNEQDVKRLLSSAWVGRLGLSVEDEPYVVPVNFCYKEGKIFIHGRAYGRKISYIKRNPEVCFEVDECNSDGSWESVIVFGHAKLSNESDLRLQVMKELFQKLARKNPRDSRVKRPARGGRLAKSDVCICEIEVYQMTGRMGGPALHERLVGSRAQN